MIINILGFEYDGRKRSIEVKLIGN